MKKIILLAVAFFTFSTGTIIAQTQKELMQERKEINKMSKAQLTQKASKDARNQAKKDAKAGWTVSPGHLPLPKQYDKFYMMQYEIDEYGYPKYMVGDATSVGENYDAAKMQALELAKQNLAGQIETNVNTLVETSMANSQLPNEQAASISETVSKSKNLISQKLGRVIPVVECYRVLRGKVKEVRVVIAYNSTMAMEAAKSAIRDEMEKKGEKLGEQLDKILGF